MPKTKKNMKFVSKRQELIYWEFSQEKPMTQLKRPSLRFSKQQYKTIYNWLNLKSYFTRPLN